MIAIKKLIANPALYSFAGFCALLMLGGCGGPDGYYTVERMESIHAKILDPPSLANTTSPGENAHFVAIRVSRPAKSGMTLTSDTVVGDDWALPGGNTNQPAHPNNYSVTLSPTAGFDYRYVTGDSVTSWDFFCSLDVGVPDIRIGMGAAGMGLSLHNSWFQARIAPALGMHQYRVSVEDSAYNTSNINPTQKFFEWSQSGSYQERSQFYSIGATVWPPDEILNPAITPLVGFQLDHISLDVEEDDASYMFSLNRMEWLVGLRLALHQKVFLNLIASDNTLFTEDSKSSYYKLESKIEYKFAATKR